MIRRTPHVVALLVIVPFTSAACGLVFGGSRQNIRVDSTPRNAAVVTDPASSQATTPTTLNLQRNRSYALTLSAAGYAPKTVDLQRKMRVGILVLDIVCGLVPVIVDAATGAWWKLEPSEAMITLERTTADANDPRVLHVTITTADEPGGMRITLTSPDPRIRATVVPR